MEETPDPLDISKEPDILKEAQNELSKLDVLVCGGCHEVFHFVEEFQKHKTPGECTNISVLKCENEEKSQIWGFTLWKVKQVKDYRNNKQELPSAWEIYQKWTKLTQIEKDLWISAGRTLQLAHRIATGKKEKPKEDKKVEKDPLAIEDEELGTNEVSNNAPNTDILKNVKIIQGSKRALRTTKDNEKEEYNVEKIIGKRFNQRKRLWEYEVKWEDYAEPTWEPLIHLENSKALVQEFEDKLKAEKELKDKDKPAGRGRGRPRLNPQTPGGTVATPKKSTAPVSPAVFVSSPGGRPQRTSKQKALNQVKAWCGNISDEESTGGVKRRLEDDAESDDSFEKKMKLEGESDTDEDEPKTMTPVRKVAKIVHTYNNGTGKKLPANVLIPDSKGVVRISQKQLPSLSSGVYIMSKSSGIIKLDPTASRIATSGGQAIVKVSPKIGQTQIRIIKKDDGSKKVMQTKADQQQQAGATTTTTAAAAIAAVTTPLTPITPKLKPVAQLAAKTASAMKKEIPKKVEPVRTPPIKVLEKKENVQKPVPNDDESDDGIPELEFPTDLPLPVPDSPPREFTLDPFTGKVAGVEYPEQEDGISDEKKPDTEILDNIVKLAAADITEEDLKTEPAITETTTTVTTVLTIAATSIVSAAASTVENASKSPAATKTALKPSPSILSTAMANSNILQKTLQSPIARPKTQPRIINQTVAKPRSAIGQVVRPPIHPRGATPIRPKQLLTPPKPRFNIAPVNPSPVKNVYSAKTNNVARKVGGPAAYKPKAAAQPPLRKPSPARPPPSPKPSISMPTLDEEPNVVVAPKVVAEVPTMEAADLATFTLASPEKSVLITGDDGTVYHIAGETEEGQTILVAQDSDGQQQCLLVSTDAIQEEVEQVTNPTEVVMEMQEPVQMAEETAMVAQFIRTEPPSPGGTHKVVVMMPDGDMMVTQVTPEEYASLELDK